MSIWYALLAAPVLALMDQGIAYATAGWACANQDSLAIHLVHGAFLALTVAGAVAAANRWRATRPLDGGEESRAGRHFLAGVATASAALSSLVIVAMWIPAWILAACIA